MKNLFYLLFTSLLLTSFGSCSDDDDNSINFYIAESYNAGGTPNLIRAESLSASIGAGSSLTIKGGSGTYTVTSDNENIAVVEPDSELLNTYFISTKKELGTTTIRVKDSNGEEASISITVDRYSIQYAVREAFAHITVKDGTTLDENIKKKIEDEIAVRLIPANHVLTLRYDKLTSGDLRISKGDGTNTPIHSGTFTETKKGPYVWYIDAEYNDKEFRYHITKFTKKAIGPVPIALVEDLTDVYKEKYPEAGLTEALAVMNAEYRYNTKEIQY